MMETFRFELTRKTTKTTLSYGNQMISANDRLHYQVKAQLTNYLRNLSRSLQTWENPVYCSSRPCIVTIDIQPPTKRRMDAPNWYPTVKALIDGFVDAGLLADDNNNVIKETRFKSTGLSETKNYILDITFEPTEGDLNA